MKEKSLVSERTSKFKPVKDQATPHSTTWKILKDIKPSVLLTITCAKMIVSNGIQLNCTYLSFSGLHM